MPVAIRALVASALIGRGRLLRRLGKPETALAASDEVVERFGTDDAPEVRALAAAALVDKGYALYRLREHEAALSVWDQALERCKTDDVPETPTMTAHALSGKCRSQILLGQSEEAVRTCDKLERRFCTLTDDDGIAFGWRAQWVKITALLVQGQHSAAMGTLRSAYSGLDPGNDAMLSEVLNWVPFLIAAKASERDLVDILSADGEKSVALTPLLVALRQRLGQTVREPTEVMEVAADVRAAIENVENASIIPLRDSGSGTIEGVLLPAPD